MAQNADRLVPTVIPSLSSGGEARFSCTHNGEPMEARIEVVTRTTRDNVMWNVSSSRAGSLRAVMPSARNKF